MTDFPDIKIKTLVSFPTTIIDGAGVDVVKQNGTYQFNIAFDDFAPPVNALTDPANQNALLWNAITNQYVLVPAAALSGSAGPGTMLPLPDATPPVRGASLYYAREDHVHPTDMSLYNGTVALTPPQQAQAATNIAAVSYGGAQTLSTDSGTTMGQRSQARSNIYAAPFDAQAYSGLQINGNCDVSQANGTTIVTNPSGNASYTVDGWKFGSQSAAAVITSATIPAASFPSPFLGVQ